MKMTTDLRDLCQEFRLDPAILRRHKLAGDVMSNFSEGFVPTEEEFDGTFLWGKKKGRAFAASSAYAGVCTQLLLGATPMVVVTFSRREWTVEVAPYCATWDGLLPAAYRPIVGREVFEAWEWRRTAPPDPVLSAATRAAIARARRRRRATFRACGTCAVPVAPEMLFGGVECEACASRQIDVEVEQRRSS